MYLWLTLNFFFRAGSNKSKLCWFKMLYFIMSRILFLLIIIVFQDKVCALQTLKSLRLFDQTYVVNVTDNDFQSSLQSILCRRECINFPYLFLFIKQIELYRQLKSSHPEVFCKTVLTHFENFTGKTGVEVSFVMKQQACNLIKKRLRHSGFPVNSTKL